MCFEGKWLQNRLRADKNESRSHLVVDIQGHQGEGFCTVPIDHSDVKHTIYIVLIGYSIFVVML